LTSLQRILGHFIGNFLLLEGFDEILLSRICIFITIKNAGDFTRHFHLRITRMKHARSHIFFDLVNVLGTPARNKTHV